MISNQVVLRLLHELVLVCTQDCSTVLEVGEELGIKDSVAFLDIVDQVHGVDGDNRDDGHDDGDPDCGLAARDFTVVGNVLPAIHGNVGESVTVMSLDDRNASLSHHRVEEEEEGHQEAGPNANSHN